MVKKKSAKKTKSVPAKKKVVKKEYNEKSYKKLNTIRDSLCDQIRMLAEDLKERRKVRQAASKAITALAQKEDLAFKCLIDELENKNIKKNVGYILVNIGKRNDSAFKYLIDALEHKNSSIRENVSNILLKIRNNSAVDPLIVVLKNDRVPNVRLAAVRVLEEIGDSRIVGHFITVMKNDQDPDVRGMAARALGRRGDPGVVVHLINTLKNDQHHLARNGAAYGLAEQLDPIAIEALITALEKDENDVRRESARALGKIIDYNSIEPLIRAIRNDSDRGVRNAAGKALVNIALANKRDTRVINALNAALNDISVVIETLEIALSKSKAKKKKKITKYQYNRDIQSSRKLLKLLSGKDSGSKNDAALRDDLRAKRKVQEEIEKLIKTLERRGLYK